MAEAMTAAALTEFAARAIGLCLRCVLVAGMIWMISGCSVGPKYRRPSAPAAPSYKELSPGDPWKTATPNDELVRGNWWEMFSDPQLSNLIQTVDITNQNVVQAEARFRAAKELLSLNRANRYPSIGVGPAVFSTALSTNLGARSFGGGVFTLFSIPFTVDWEPDFWGRISLAIRNAEALAQVSAADLENIRLSMRAALASSYFQMAGFDMQIAVLNETIDTYEKALNLTKLRYAGGVATRIDVVQAQAQLDETHARLSETELARSNFEHAIAVLAGQTPSSFSLPATSIRNPAPPIPVGLPSQLLERRPDIAAAERQVAAANAQIGLARVAYYPLVTLTGSGGLESSRISNLFSWPSRFWSLGTGATQTLFDFGRRRALSSEAEANYDATVAAYRQTVLTAFQEVEDQIAALRQLAEAFMRQESALKASEEALQLEIVRYKRGIDSYLDVVTSQTIALENKLAVIVLLQRRMSAAVDLIRSLGGGWTEADLPKF